MSPFKAMKSGVWYGEADPWKYYLRNCTSYVAEKLSSLGVPDSYIAGLGNGGNWYDNSVNKSGLTRGTTPQVGDAAVWPSNTYGNSFGHVAYVEAVNSDGTIKVSEYNYDLDGTGDYRTGTPASMHFTEFVHFAPFMTNPPSGSSGSSSGSPTDNGKFVSYHGAVYLIAGRAPLYVSGSDASYLPDWTTAQAIDDGQWASLRPFPDDGTYLSDVQTGAVYVTVGGAPMYISGADAPYLPNWTTARRVPHWDFVNYQHLRQYPADGYYLADAQSGFVYNTAGGVPFYVSGQDAPALPQWQYATRIPHGELVGHMHLRTIPADGTYITDVETGMVYITLGGAPMYISGTDASYLPNWAGATRVSHWEFQSWSYLRPYPADGYFLRDVQTGAIFETAGGAPLYVSGSDAAFLPQWQYASPVPHWELQNWGHLRQYPADNTYLADVQTGKVYVTAGGAPLYISPAGGPYLPAWQSAVHVPGWDFVNHGNLLQLPADGTYVRGVPSGEVFQMVSGVAVRVTTNPLPVATNVDDWAIVNQLGGTL
jgi:surface antigen